MLERANAAASLIVRHAGAYGELIAEDVGLAYAALLRRLWAGVVLTTEYPSGLARKDRIGMAEGHRRYAAVHGRQLHDEFSSRTYGGACLPAESSRARRRIPARRRGTASVVALHAGADYTDVSDRRL